MMYGKTKKVTVQEYVEVQDGYETVKQWQDKGTVEAIIWLLRGDETYQSATDTRIIQHRMGFDIPDFEITEDDRIVETDLNDNVIQEYDIEVVNDLNLQGKRYEIDLKVVK